MAKINRQSQEELDRATPVALETAIRILESWSCEPAQTEVILGLSKQLMGECYHNPKQVHLTQEQQERLSYVLNIYQAIKTLFSQQANVDNFMSLKNCNGMFNGKAPLDFILEGHLDNLKYTYLHIQSLSGH